MVTGIELPGFLFLAPVHSPKSGTAKKCVDEAEGSFRLVHVGMRPIVRIAMRFDIFNRDSLMLEDTKGKAHVAAKYLFCAAVVI